MESGGTGLGRWRRKITRGRILIGSALVLLAAVWWFVPPVWRLTSGPVTVTRYEKKRGEVQAVVGPGTKDWTPSRHVSRHVHYAIVSAEDGRFFEHHGLDLGAIRESFNLNLKTGQYLRGGSTITQQVVKVALLSREKTLIRKAREAVGALLLELILPKDRILEWYVNLVEFGDGVYGVTRGAAHYFNTKPQLLTIEQAIHLALVLPSPNKWSRGLRNRRLTPFGHRQFKSILNRMRQSGYITRAQWAAAVSRGDFGRPLAGYANLLAAEKASEPLCPGNPGCPSTLDPDPDDDGESEADAAPPPSVMPSGAESGGRPGPDAPAAPMVQVEPPRAEDTATAKDPTGGPDADQADDFASPERVDPGTVPPESGKGVPDP